MRRLFAVTKSYFNHTITNIPLAIIPLAWLLSPFCIFLGYVLLDDWMLGIKESDYKGTKDEN